MRRIFTSVLCISALCAWANPPLPKSAVNPDNSLREVSLNAMKKGAHDATPLTVRPLDVSPDNALTLPVSYDLSSGALSSYPIVDANDDGYTWKFENDYSLGPTACYESFMTTGGADDWIILPFINYPSATGSYTVSLQTKAMSLPESFEICISPTTNIEDAVQIASFNVPGSFAYTPVAADFTVPTAGKYCMMFHATSAAKGISLYITQIKVEANETDSEGFTVPFSMVPEASQARYFTYVDANEDGITFAYDSSNSGFSYTTNSSNPNPGDDYVLFPEINIPATGNYKFTWTPRGWGTSVESMEVLFGQGEDLSTYNVVHTDRNIGEKVYQREVVVHLTEGAWRPALHCISMPNQYKLLVKNFTLDATTDSPATELPYNDEGPMSVTAAAPAITKAFILPEATRILVDFDHVGSGVTVGLANAPVASAATTIFTVAGADALNSVSEKFSVPDGGIRYLVITTTGTATVSNLNISVFNDETPAYELPFEMQPTAEQFSEFMVVNANNDASTWTYYDQFGAPRYNYSNNEKADDWLILPAINIPSTDEMLNFSLQVRGMGKSFTETFEVWEGSTTDIAEMRMIYSSPEVHNEAFEDFGFSFAPAHSGTTYFAIRATSEPRQFHIFVKNFKIEADTRPSAIPAAVTDLAAEALPMGSPEAKVTFTMPTVSAANAPLDPATALTAEVKSAYQTIILNGHPGESMECTVTNGQGEGEISVVILSDAGESNAAVTTVYTGQHLPGLVTNVTIAADETNRIATLTWTLPTEGADGGYVDASQVTYTVSHSSGNSSLRPVGTTDPGVCTFTYEVSQNSSLQMHYFIVTASNIAGDGPVPTSTSGVVLGKPHTIPATDDFSDGTISLGPVGMSYPDESYILDWYFDNPANAFDEAANLSGRALIAFTEVAGAARGRLHLPKFDTHADNGARVVLRVFNYPHFGPTGVFANTFETKGIKIGEIKPATQAGWVEYSFPMPAELMDKTWVEVYVDFGFDGTNDDEIWMLDRFGVENYFDTELDVRGVVTHNRIKANEKSDWKFTAANYGKTDITFDVPTLNFTTNDGETQQFEAVSPVEASVTLRPGEVVELCYEPVPDTLLEGEGVYDLSIVVPEDGNPDNNFVAEMMTIWLQEEFVVRDLSAARSDDSNGNNVVLTWSEPLNDWGILYMDNLESWDAGDQIGLFNNYDGDKMPTMMFFGNTFPGMGYPKAWQVFDYEAAGFDYPYAGYMGTTKSLIVFCPGDNVTAADDWLISPEVKGGTEIEFQVRPLHFAYGSETIEILTSSTGRSIEDFTLLSTYRTQRGDASKTPYWEEVKATLPEDARYFAIRYVSAGIFGLQLDDVIYTPAQGEYADGHDPLTYTVFRDGEVIATGVEGTTYTDTYPGTAYYHIAAEKVYGGLHPLSNRASVEVSSVASVTDESGFTVVGGKGLMTLTCNAPKHITVVATDGTVVYSADCTAGSHTMNLGAGIYIVTADNEPSVKAVVR